MTETIAVCNTSPWTYPAGPVACCAVYLTDTVGLPTGQFSTRSYQYSNLLQDLVAANRLYYYFWMLEADRLQGSDYRVAINDAIDLCISRLLLTLAKKSIFVTKYIRSATTQPGWQYPTVKLRDNNWPLIIAQSIVEHRRRIDIIEKGWFRRWPLPEKHLGRMDQTHFEWLHQHAPTENHIFQTTAQQYLCYWINQVAEYNEYCCLIPDPIANPPRWWDCVSTQSPIALLGTNYIKTYEQIINPVPPP